MNLSLNAQNSLNSHHATPTKYIVLIVALCALMLFISVASFVDLPGGGFPWLTFLLVSAILAVLYIYIMNYIPSNVLNSSNNTSNLFNASNVNYHNAWANTSLFNGSLFNGSGYSMFGSTAHLNEKNEKNEKNETTRTENNERTTKTRTKKNIVGDMFGKQVFNVPQNKYTYPEANAVCAAYGAELADYSQVEHSYDKGGEWCNYGWSKGQMVLFPTQKKTYDTLQGISGHHNDCGRPGVNGGYIDNPGAQFGVNCYGFKPAITSLEQEQMNNISPIPQTAKDIEMAEMVQYWKGRLNEIMVSPFNNKRWNQI